MKMSRIVTLSSVAVAAASIATTASHAAVLAEYDAGVTPAAGEAGAVDPITQGWENHTNGSNAWSDAYDSGNGGWRIMDATSSANIFYSQTLDASDTSLMDANGWSLTWTVSMDSSAIQSDGDTAQDYYLPPNNSRQDNNGIWIERADQYRYNLRLHATDDGDLAVFDGLNEHVLTDTGDNTGYDTFVTMQIDYDANTNTATLTYGDSVYELYISSNAPSTDRILFGATSSGGVGSVVYNTVRMEAVPEPASAVLTALGLGAVLLRRRGRISA